MTKRQLRKLTIMKTRYFIGIALPTELSRAISDLQNTLPASGSLMQPLVPHITLLHPNLLINLPPAQLLPNIKTAAKAFLPLDIQLTHTSRFGGRVLYLAINSAEVMCLQKTLFQLLPEKAQAQQDANRTFTPHITLMQVKRKQQLPEQQVGTLNSQIESLLPYHFRAKQLALFTWSKPRTYRINII